MDLLHLQVYTTLTVEMVGKFLPTDTILGISALTIRTAPAQGCACRLLELQMLKKGYILLLLLIEKTNKKSNIC